MTTFTTLSEYYPNYSQIRDQLDAIDQLIADAHLRLNNPKDDDDRRMADVEIEMHQMQKNNLLEAYAQMVFETIPKETQDIFDINQRNKDHSIYPLGTPLYNIEMDDDRKERFTQYILAFNPEIAARFKGGKHIKDIEIFNEGRRQFHKDMEQYDIEIQEREATITRETDIADRILTGWERFSAQHLVTGEEITLSEGDIIPEKPHYDEYPDDLRVNVVFSAITSEAIDGYRGLDAEIAAGVVYMDTEFDDYVVSERDARLVQEAREEYTIELNITKKGTVVPLMSRTEQPIVSEGKEYTDDAIQIFDIETIKNGFSQDVQRLLDAVYTN